MGSKSSGSTASTTTNDIDTTQSNIQGVEGPAGSASGMGRVTIIESDQGAIDRAFGFGSDALDANRRGSERSFDFGSDALRGFGALANRSIDDAFQFSRESLGLVERSAGAAQKSFEGALSSTLANLDEQQSGGAQRVLLLAALAIAAVVAVGFLRR